MSIPVDGEDIVSRWGDAWLLGDDHRLVCGNMQNPESWALLMDGQKADMAFTDPPYNVSIDGNVSGLGNIHHREFIMGAGEMSDTEFSDFLKDAFTLMTEHSRDGALHFVCMDWRHVMQLMASAETIYHECKNLCVWTKTNAGMGSLYRSQHELVFVFKHGTAKHINNVELGKYGRYRTNVWSYPGCNTFSVDREENLLSHPTVKPVEMVKDAILDCTKRGDIVIDPFAGRRGFGIEIDPIYADVAIRRWQLHTGKSARHAETGRLFDEMDEEINGTDNDTLPAEEDA